MTDPKTKASDASRRGALRAGVAAAAGASAAVTSSASSAAADLGAVRAHRRIQLLDGDYEQRFLLQTSRPPGYVNGAVYERKSPLHASYFIFNDQEESERGGITVDRDFAQVSLDWPNVDAVHLGAYLTTATNGLASLTMRQMPDPASPPDQVTEEDSPEREVLGPANSDGALLALNDSLGRPRIVLQVAANDQPFIVILDGEGNVDAQLPPADGSPAVRPDLAAWTASSSLRPYRVHAGAAEEAAGVR